MAAQASSDVVQPVLQSKGDPRTMREKSCVLDDQTRSKSKGAPSADCVSPFWTTHVCVRALQAALYGLSET